MKTRWISLIILLVLALSSCDIASANKQEESLEPTKSLATPSEETLAAPLPSSPSNGDNLQMTPTLSAPSAPNLQNLIEKAKGDLAQRLSISENEIILLKATDVVWPDSSLGCPQKGMVYADMLRPGYLIILTANSKEYEYHTSKGTEIVHCENPNPPVQDMPGDT